MFKCFFGHRWYSVYRNPAAQHPVHIVRNHPTKVVCLAGEIVPDLQFKQRCDKCGVERWK